MSSVELNKQSAVNLSSSIGQTPLLVQADAKSAFSAALAVLQPTPSMPSAPLQQHAITVVTQNSLRRDFAEAPYKEALGLLEARKYEEAAKVLNSNENNGVDSALLCGKVALEISRTFMKPPHTGLDALKKVIKILKESKDFPDSKPLIIEAHRICAQIYETLYQFKEAKENYLEIIKLSSKDASAIIAYNFLGVFERDFKFKTLLLQVPASSLEMDQKSRTDNAFLSDYSKAQMLIKVINFLSTLPDYSKTVNEIQGSAGLALLETLVPYSSSDVFTRQLRALIAHEIGAIKMVKEDLETSFRISPEANFRSLYLKACYLNSEDVATCFTFLDDIKSRKGGFILALEDTCEALLLHKQEANLSRADSIARALISQWEILQKNFAEKGTGLHFCYFVIATVKSCTKRISNQEQYFEFVDDLNKASKIPQRFLSRYKLALDMIRVQLFFGDPKNFAEIVICEHATKDSNFDISLQFFHLAALREQGIQQSLYRIGNNAKIEQLIQSIKSAIDKKKDPDVLEVTGKMISDYCAKAKTNPKAQHLYTFYKKIFGIDLKQDEKLDLKLSATSRESTAAATAPVVIPVPIASTAISVVELPTATAAHVTATPVPVATGAPIGVVVALKSMIVAPQSPAISKKMVVNPPKTNIQLPFVPLKCVLVEPTINAKLEEVIKSVMGAIGNKSKTELTRYLEAYAFLLKYMISGEVRSGMPFNALCYIIGSRLVALNELPPDTILKALREQIEQTPTGSNEIEIFVGLLARADLYLELYEKENALVDLLRALKLFPQSDLVKYKLMEFYIYERDFSTAKKYYRQISKYNFHLSFSRSYQVVFDDTLSEQQKYDRLSNFLMESVGNSKQNSEMMLLLSHLYPSIKYVEHECVDKSYMAHVITASHYARDYVSTLGSLNELTKKKAPYVKVLIEVAIEKVRQGLVGTGKKLVQEASSLKTCLSDEDWKRQFQKFERALAEFFKTEKGRKYTEAFNLTELQVEPTTSKVQSLASLLQETAAVPTGQATMLSSQVFPAAGIPLKDFASAVAKPKSESNEKETVAKVEVDIKNAAENAVVVREHFNRDDVYESCYRAFVEDIFVIDQLNRPDVDYQLKMATLSDIEKELSSREIEWDESLTEEYGRISRQLLVSKDASPFKYIDMLSQQIAELREEPNKMNSKSIAALKNRAVIYSELFEIDKAMEDLIEILEIQPNDLSVRFNLAILKFMTNINEAKVHFQYLAEHKYLLHVVAPFLKVMENSEQANTAQLKKYRLEVSKAIEKADSDIARYYLLQLVGYLYFLQNNYVEAEKNFDLAIKLHGVNPVCLLYQGAIFALQEEDECIRTIKNSKEPPCDPQGLIAALIKREGNLPNLMCQIAKKIRVKKRKVLATLIEKRYSNGDDSLEQHLKEGDIKEGHKPVNEVIVIYARKIKEIVLSRGTISERADLVWEQLRLRQADILAMGLKQAEHQIIGEQVKQSSFKINPRTKEYYFPKRVDAIQTKKLFTPIKFVKGPILGGTDEKNGKAK